MIAGLATRLLSHIANELPKFSYVRRLTAPAAMRRLLQTLRAVAVAEVGDEKAVFNDFFSQCMTIVPGSILFCSEMHQAYREFCSSTGRALMPADTFFRLAALEIRKRFGIARRNDLKKEGEWRRGFVGLKLTDKL
jgi:hypothetical protein